MRVLRRIAEKRRVNRVRNVEIREELKQEGVLEKVRSQVRWREALAEMGPERLVRTIYKAEIEGRKGMIILSNDMLTLSYYYMYK